MIISTSYGLPLAHLVAICNYNEIHIEAHETFQKQSFRNRMHLVSSSGLQSLSVPVKHNGKQLITKTEISYKEEWQRNHLRTIQTCYNKSPFYLYYSNEIERIISKKHPFLFDLNSELNAFICKSMRIPIPRLTLSWNKIENPDRDLRIRLQDKKIIEMVTPVYPALFEIKVSELALLSSLDLLFNLGPDSFEFIRQCKLNLI